MKEMFYELGVERVENEPQSKMLTWDMVRDMAVYGIEFGAHSVTHSVLSKLPVHEMTQELRQSKSDIEKCIGAEVRCMAYPVGGVSAFNSDVVSACEQTGYQFACSYLSGVNDIKDMDRYALRRIHVDSSVTLDWFKARLSLPSFCASSVAKE